MQFFLRTAWVWLVLHTFVLARENFYVCWAALTTEAHHAEFRSDRRGEVRRRRRSDGVAESPISPALNKNQIMSGALQSGDSRSGRRTLRQAFH